MPRANETVERVARDRLHRLAVSAAPRGFEFSGWVPEAPPEAADDRDPDDRDPEYGAPEDGVPAGPPDEDDVRDVVARLRVGALEAAAAAYTAAHGNALEHPYVDGGSGRRRWHLSVRLAVVAGVAIAVLGAGVAARATLMAPSMPVAAIPTPDGPTTVDATAPAAGPGRASGIAGLPDGDPSRSSSGAGATSVLVDVVGAVVAPGVVQLRAGSRVSDAVAAAGGAAPGADIAAINLARVVGDGEQVVVPVPGEVAGGTNGAGPGAGGGKDPVVDLNSADLADLDALPGIGPVLAQRVLDWRAQHGRFHDVAELGEVSGIGDALLGRLRDLVRV
ncbi:MAG TPA: helix-hairpin-helix domain-containing protein [Pengzhenrongella sp.]